MHDRGEVWYGISTRWIPAARLEVGKRQIKGLRQSVVLQQPRGSIPSSDAVRIAECDEAGFARPAASAGARGEGSTCFLPLVEAGLTDLTHGFNISWLNGVRRLFVSALSFPHWNPQAFALDLDPHKIPFVTSFRWAPLAAANLKSELNLRNEGKFYVHYTHQSVVHIQYIHLKTKWDLD